MFLEEMLWQQGGNIGMLLSAGFLIGLLHAFEPDHMAAMLTMVQKRKDSGAASAKLGLKNMRNSLLGAFWGFGHASMILLVCFLVFVLAFNVPSAVFDGFEFVVGAMLVVLGFSMYGRKVFQLRHSHPHAHENGIVHTHPHRHDGPHKHTHKSYLIGCIHGLAGSGSLVAISAAMLNDVSAVFSFVILFGAGSIVGMMLLSGTLSATIFSSRFAKIRKYVQVLAGTITVIIGFEIIYGLITSERLPAF